MGAIDNVHDAADEPIEAPAERARWFQGTSRDLFGWEGEADTTASNEATDLGESEAPRPSLGELAADSPANEEMGNDGSVYQTREPRYDGKTDHFFNESGNMRDQHGHVVEGRDSTPERTTYDYVRDVDGTVYIDRR